MSGIYGTIRPADINISEDAELFYYYRPTRSTNDSDFRGFKKLDSNCLVKSSMESGDTTANLLGMYDLRLPLDKFNKKGFYTVYIRPKEIICELKDVSVLAAYPTVRGIVVSINDVNISDLTGYRVEFLDNTGKRNGNACLITSSNRSTPIMTTNDTTPRYRLDDSSSSYLFCTVTPSTASSFKPNSKPDIGTAGQKVAIINTKFSPVMFEIEMVEHDADTLSYMLEGDQIRDRDHALITTYNDDKEIYHQHDYFTIKSSLGTPLYDVKRKKETIDGTQKYDNIINEKVE